MKFLDLQHHFHDFLIFSVQDIRKIDPQFDVRRLVEWQQKGYIQKIIRNFYCFSEFKFTEEGLFMMANTIYPPSYISFEMALSFYHLIPESTYGITSATTKKTAAFQTPVGHFSYRSLKTDLFFGYTLHPYRQRQYQIADMEKALLDYLYLNPQLQTGNDFEGMRINNDELFSTWNEQRLNTYLTAFGSNALTKRVTHLLQFLHHDHI